MIKFLSKEKIVHYFTVLLSKKLATSRAQIGINFFEKMYRYRKSGEKGKTERPT